MRKGAVAFLLITFLGLLYSQAEPTPCNIFIYSDASTWHYSFDSLKVILERLGNTVRLENRGTLPNLAAVLPGDYSQFWFINGDGSGAVRLTAAERDSIVKFAEMGRGVAILGDHSPAFSADVNYISARWGVSFTGYRDHSGSSSCDSSVLLYPHSITDSLVALQTNSSEGKLTYTGPAANYTVLATKLTAGNDDTLMAVYVDDSIHIFFDASFVRYQNGRVEVCGGPQLVKNISCWFEPGGCGCVPCSVSVDSVWFSEETECNDSNIVEICYTLSGNCPDSTYTVSVAISPEGGGTWFHAGEGWFHTFRDSAGDFGPGVHPGTHCFKWLMSADLPDTEDSFWTVRVAVTDTLLADSFAALDTTRYTITGNDGFVVPDSEYFVITQDLPYRNGRLMTVDTFYWANILVDFWFKMSPGTCDVAADSTGADGISVIFTPYLDPVIAAGGSLGILGTDGWGVEFDTYNNYCGDSASDIDGNHIAISIDSVSCMWIGSAAIPYSLVQVPVPFEMIDSGWHHAVIEVNYPHCRVELDGTVYIDEDVSGLPPPFWAHIGISGSTGGCHSEQVVDNLVITQPVNADTVRSSAECLGPLDSQPPRIDIGCPESFVHHIGDTIVLSWHLEDLFWSDSLCSLWATYDTVSYAAEIGGTSAVFVCPPTCDSITLVVSARDSFCNIGYDTCRFALCSHPEVSFLCPPCWRISSCRNQEITAVMVDTFCASVPESVEVTIIVADSMGAEDTISLVGPSSQVYFEPAGDSTIIHIGGIDFSDGDSVAVLLNRIKTSRGCWEDFWE